MTIQLAPVCVVSVRKTLTVSPVSVEPLKVRVEYVVVLTAFAAEFAVTATEKSSRAAVALEQRTDRPVTATPVVELATGVMSTSPLAMFGAENTPVPVMSAKVTSLVVATACPIDTTAAPALTPDPVIVTPVDPVAVAM